MTDNIEKDIRNMLAIKHDIIKILIENETDNKIYHEETENFIFFINAILNKNKSKNSIEGSGGKITFHTSDAGTTFYIYLKKSTS